jgi:histidinol-phosphate phosphatase family protein
MAPAVFLDRDGTLIEERHYLRRPEEVVVLPGVTTALRRLQQAGFKLLIVSNQSGVGRGYFTLADVERVHERIRDEFSREGVEFENIYFADKSFERCSD